MRILEGSTTLGENQYLTWGLSHSSTYQHYVTEKQWEFSYHAEYTNTNTSNKTFKVQLYEDHGVMELNGGPGTDEGLSWLTVMEVL